MRRKRGAVTDTDSDATAQQPLKFATDRIPFCLGRLLKIFILLNSAQYKDVLLTMRLVGIIIIVIRETPLTKRDH